jgi:hypothetical protein
VYQYKSMLLRLLKGSKSKCGWLCGYYCPYTFELQLNVKSKGTSLCCGRYYYLCEVSVPNRCCKLLQVNVLISAVDSADDVRSKCINLAVAITFKHSK